ncbi:MAG: hypothetical protein M1839_007114 [Geoglossum umbratile]|nr:MAG: hypothetical protein M1839_007114 [Geoglossum umbratile]
MPSDAECQAFWDEEVTNKRTKCSKIGEAMCEKWPVKADRMEFYVWSKAKADKRFKEREMTNVSAQELTEMLATMNFNNDILRGKLVNILERSVVPWLPVGNDRTGAIYRIVPGAFGLLPDQQDPKTNRELVPMNVLGVNTNVQLKIPSRSRKLNFSEESTKSNESDDLETEGFVFHQIGNLEYWGGGPRDRRIVTSDWGRLPGGGPQFSIAKIANKITDLRFGRTFDLAEALDYPVELVRAVKTPEDAVIRATVA